MPPTERPQLLALAAPPPGDYDSWSDEEAFNAEHHCYCFAQEYVVDHNASQAALRLGFPPKDCAVVGTRYIQHWLTQHYLKEISRSFLTNQQASKDVVMSLVYRDASNFNKGSNPMARVAAQKIMVQVLDMNAPKKVEKTINAGRGGVMLVPPVQSAEEWQSGAMTRQATLKREVRD